MVVVPLAYASGTHFYYIVSPLAISLGLIRATYGYQETFVPLTQVKESSLLHKFSILLTTTLAEYSTEMCQMYLNQRSPKLTLNTSKIIIIIVITISIEIIQILLETQKYYKLYFGEMDKSVINSFNTLLEVIVSLTPCCTNRS